MSLFKFFKKGDSIQQSATSSEVRPISYEDMRAFENTGFQFSSPIFIFDRKNIMLLEGENISKTIETISDLNNYVLQAKELAGTHDNLCINPIDIEFKSEVMNVGKKDQCVQYNSFIQCQPYTKTGKISKYPVILYYNDKYLTQYKPPKTCFGNVYYLQDGKIGKVEMVCNLSSAQFRILLELREETLAIKKVVESDYLSSRTETLYFS